MPKLSKREIIYFCRSLEINKNDFVKFFNMDDEDKMKSFEDYNCHYLKNFDFSISFNNTYMDDEDDDKIYYIDVDLRFNGGGFIETIGRIIESNIENNIETIINKLKSLEDNLYNKCKECDDHLSIKDDLCKLCYPKVIYNEDYNCVICKDDTEEERIWIQLDKCKHIFHWKCFNELRKNNHKKCPLCRDDNINWNFI
jgi:hypothetical protein